METKMKKAEVVMLTTNKKAEIGEFGIWTSCIYNTKKDTTKLVSGHKLTEPYNCAQIRKHLYIVTNNKIEEGDYCIDGDSLFGPYENGNIALDNFKKIIATTNTSLNLPKIKTSFINKYIEEYNKGNKIKEVLVDWLYSGRSYFDSNGIEQLQTLGANITLHNEITIKKLKDCWNKDEVIKLITKFNSEHSDLYSNTLNEWISKQL